MCRLRVQIVSLLFVSCHREINFKVSSWVRNHFVFSSKRCTICTSLVESILQVNLTMGEHCLNTRLLPFQSCKNSVFSVAGEGHSPKGYKLPVAVWRNHGLFIVLLVNLLRTGYIWVQGKEKSWNFAVVELRILSCQLSPGVPLGTLVQELLESSSTIISA